MYKYPQWNFLLNQHLTIRVDRGGGSRGTEQGPEAVGWVVDEIDGRSRLVGRIEGLGGSGFLPEEKAINKLADHDGV